MRNFIVTTVTCVAIGLTGWQPTARACEQTDLVQSWYYQYLGRSLDPVGLHCWVPQLRNGAAPQVVLAGILGSEEYYCRNGHSRDSFVRALYHDVLNRRACEPEVEAWVCHLQKVGCRERLSADFLTAAGTELALRNERAVHASPTRYVPAVVPAPVLPIAAPVVNRPYDHFAPRPGLGIYVGFSKRGSSQPW